ncbi:MAG: adenylyl-sulfate kinase, partial [candidate division WOR-3 bacterium]
EGDNFIEVYVKCSVDECARRDPKGHYQKARAGLIKGYTGVDSPYEEPEVPDVIINSESLTIDEAVMLLYEKLRDWLIE